eukprot:CFRG4561T1
MFARQITARLLCKSSAALRAVAVARPYSSAFGRPVIGSALHHMPRRLDDKALPFYFHESPDDRHEHAWDYSAEEKNDRQELIDKIIAMADSNQEPGVKEYEEVLELVIKYGDLNGINVLLKASKEKGVFASINEDLIDRAYATIQ